ncbi:class I SAM-dependent methyltransferase [bacterium]|nr:class I SAM-dependent methyltransferase [bacterium]
MKSFKDLFSENTQDYAKFRPVYPEALFTYLASTVQSHDLAFDVGTGSGQAAVVLAKHFKRVIATDPSQKQLDAATKHPHVVYQQGPAEKLSAEAGSVDLLTAAQAFHWFKREEFFKEADRVLKPGGVLALWTYSMTEISPDIDRTVHHLYEELLGKYWEPERRLVEEGYRSVTLPFPELQSPKIEMQAKWSLAHLVGYLGTWSALKTCIQKTGQNPLEQVFPDLQQAWGQSEFRSVKWPLSIRVCQRSIDTKSHRL